MSLLTPPFTVPVGQTCVFALPTTTAASGTYGGVCFGGNSYSLDGSSDLNTGSLATFSGCPFAPNTASVQWGGFFVPRWPNGTVIHNIYPVLYISASHYGNSDTECDLLLNGSAFERLMIRGWEFLVYHRLPTVWATREQLLLRPLWECS